MENEVSRHVGKQFFSMKKKRTLKKKEEMNEKVKRGRRSGYATQV